MNLVKLPNRKLENVTESEFLDHFQSSRSVKRGDYQTILSNWLTVFPTEQLYIGFFEDIKNQPQKLLEDIFLHIGVSADVNWASFPYKQVIYQGVGYSMFEKYRLFLKEMYREDLQSLHTHFGERVSGWLDD